jgi:predicted transcriptional regulator of viral defense system
VLDKIRRSPGGTLFFVESFANIANAKSTNKSLERLVKSGKLERVAHGIYVLPVIDEYLGKVLPSIEKIAIAKWDRAKIIPAGSYAFYKLGLTTQMCR